MTLRPRSIVGATAFALALATAAPARADSSYLELFKQGRALLEQNKPEEALDKFTQSEELSPNVGTLLNIARCLDMLGKPSAALAKYSEAKSLAISKRDNRVSDAEKGERDMEPKVGRLTISVPKNSGDIAVAKNGAAVDAGALNTPAAVDPGHYLIEATAPGKKAWSTQIDVLAGARSTVSVPALEADTASAPPPPAPISNTQRNVGIGLEIGGGAVFAAGWIFGAVALGKWSGAKDACPNGICPNEATRDRYTSAQTFATLSTVGLIAGGVVAAGGVVLHLTAPKHTDVAIAPSVGPTALGAFLTITN